MADQEITLACAVLDHTRAGLLVPLRFLESAFHQLNPRFGTGASGTDGRWLYCDADVLLRDFARDPRQIARNYLHTVLHAIFHHLSHPKAQDPLYQVAADMAVEYTILNLALPFVATARDEAQRMTLMRYEKAVPLLTAERLYRYFHTHPMPESDLEGLRRLFHRDDHLPWQDCPTGVEEGAFLDEESGLALSDAYDILEAHASGGAKEWEVISSEVEIALEDMREGMGNAAAAMRQQLRALSEDSLSYDEFLRRFAAPREALQLNDDEFDPIFYTYGLRTYGNLPLIEPQETAEVEKIDEFVIAIDTSGSCSGELVQAFLEKTVSLLKSSGRFQHRVNVRVLQCDSRLQHETHLTHLDGIADYLSAESLHGFGGTDFRPVFARVDELLAEGAFTDLKGLLYFTDGMGVYPKKVPPYDTGFVFLDEGPMLENADFPSWAMKVVLSRDDIVLHPRKGVASEHSGRTHTN